MKSIDRDFRVDRPAALLVIILITLLIGGCANGPASGGAPGGASPRAFGSKNPRPKNLIIVIPDGMGPAQVTLAREYWNNGRSSLVFDDILVGSARTAATNRNITDSAAAGTAIATGVNSYKGAIAVDTERVPRVTMLEEAERLGMVTGMVVTSSIQHATPAAFSSHARKRTHYRRIAAQQLDKNIEIILGGGRMFWDPMPNIEDDDCEDFVDAVPGTAIPDACIFPDLFQSAKQRGIRVVQDSESLLASDETPVIGVFDDDWMAPHLDRDSERGRSQPSLLEMTQYALRVLSQRARGNGFFLLVEASMIDGAGHYHEAAALAHEMRAYEVTMRVVLDFAAQDGNTLVVSLADHETGGLSLGRDYEYDDEGEIELIWTWDPDILKRASCSMVAAVDMVDEGVDPVDAFKKCSGIESLGDDELSILSSIGNLDLDNDDDLRRARIAMGDIVSKRANINWSAWGHTAVDVNVYAYGPGSDRFVGHRANDEVGRITGELMGFDRLGQVSGNAID